MANYLKYIAILDADTNTGIRNIRAMTIATEIPVLFSLTFIYSSARAQSVSALRTKRDPREDTPPDMIVLAKVKSALAQIELSQIEYFLRYGSWVFSVTAHCSFGTFSFFFDFTLTFLDFPRSV